MSKSSKNISMATPAKIETMPLKLPVANDLTKSLTAMFCKE